ncbi:MAG: hypothetical protein DRJ03_09330 [Chloroflexi bacterium]|nr:MAG: hypothetical protein DRJ03_09330 [Chloroflexota bacterium]
MVRVKSVEEAKKHLEQAVSLIPDRYESGVKAANWKEPALAGEDLFADMMSVVVSERRRAKGIEKTSDEDWRNRAVTKGKPIIGTRIRDALGRYASGWAPYRAAIEGVTLEPKTVDPMANIDRRVKPIVEALINKKKELLGS